MGSINDADSDIMRFSGVTKTPWDLIRSTSDKKAQGSKTTPFPITDSFPPRTTPDGKRESL